MNVLGIVIAVLVAVASGEYDGRLQTVGRRDSFVNFKHGSEQTIEEVVELFEALTRSKNKLVESLDSYGTVLRVNDEKINLIRQRDIPSFVLSNKQQTGLIDLSGEEIDDLISEVHSAQDRAAATFVIAIETANITEALEKEEHGIADWNAEQNATIASINITEDREDLLQLLKTDIHHLKETLEGIEAKIKTVDNFVQSRHCESGTVQAYIPNDKDNIVLPQYFLSNFGVSPDVVVSLTGFADSIDENGDNHKKGNDNDGKNNYNNNYGKNNYDNKNGKSNHDNDRNHDDDELGIRVSAEEITTRGFNVRVRGFSDGRLENRVATARWTACQNQNQNQNIRTPKKFHDH